MSRYKIEITEPAENDLYQIGHYISEELLEPDAAKSIVKKIAEAVLSLEDMPLRNKKVADEKLALLGIRRIIIDNYIVFYIASEEKKTVTVIRILFGKRDWINLL